MSIGTDSVRVKMAYRKMKVEENTKYIPTIYNIVYKKAKYYFVRQFIILKFKN